MNSNTNSLSPLWRGAISAPVAVLLVAVGLLLGQQRSEAVRPVLAQPAVIATVDLERLFNNLDERKAVDEKVKAMTDAFDTEAKSMRDSIQMLEGDVELMAVGSPDRLRAEEEWVRASGRLKVYLDYAAWKLDQAESQYLADIYNNIKTATAAMAVQTGIDVVFVDDSIVPLPENVRGNEMMRQISARRMLYGNTGVDVTDELLTRMNNQFNAGP